MEKRKSLPSASGRQLASVKVSPLVGAEIGKPIDLPVGCVAVPNRQSVTAHHLACRPIFWRWERECRRSVCG